MVDLKFLSFFLPMNKRHPIVVLTPPLGGFSQIREWIALIVMSPLYNSVENKFASLFKNVVLGNLKSFFQLDHQVDTRSTTTWYYLESVALKPSWCTWLAVLVSRTLKSIFFSLRMKVGSSNQPSSSLPASKVTFILLNQ